MSWSLFDESQPFGNVIYTDGSKIQNRVGCAFVQFQENDEIFSDLFRLSDEASLYSCRQAVNHEASENNFGLPICSYVLSFGAVIINEIKDNKEIFVGHPVNLDTGIRGKRTCRSVGKDGLNKGSCGFFFLSF
ncbi:hypothetical protein AVEN_131215-1 [Araneus ventricosus]|uniref:RNase H type-1 domain-containing protein n=1 Tax=Araneus ventricosus TaxID=182803 RepID=A0A4Y2PLX1_ARAVE|nr:hypothetical protein AVEN_131215-1 [Araneus ventricosus]